MEPRTIVTEPVKQSDIILQPVITQESIRQIAELSVSIWHEHYDSIIGKAQVDYMTEKFQSENAIQEQISQEGYHYYMLVGLDGPSGYFAYRFSEGLFLSKIYIAAQFRGNGFSRRVMNFLKEICKEQQWNRIWLTVNKNNSSSIAVYERLGFIKLKTMVTDIGDGFVMDDYVMELNLGP